MPAAPRRAGNRNVAPPSGKVPAPPQAERSACPRPHRNLRRRRQFDAERVAGTVHRNDEGLRAGLAEEVPGMEAVVRKHRAGVAGGHQRTNGPKVESGREQPTMAVDHAHAEVVGIRQAPAGPAHRLDHLEVPEVVGVRAIHADDEKRSVFLDGGHRARERPRVKLSVNPSPGVDHAPPRWPPAVWAARAWVSESLVHRNSWPVSQGIHSLSIEPTRHWCPCPWHERN